MSRQTIDKKTTTLIGPSLILKITCTPKNRSKEVLPFGPTLYIYIFNFCQSIWDKNGVV
jgi:hypothetical protein